MLNVKDIINWFKDASYDMLKAGKQLPIAGMTGSMTTNKFVDQKNTQKSRRVMRTERGPQPEAIGDRRFIRYADRAAKRKNSFCNNLDHTAKYKVAS